jgi:hypothetical protein
MNIARVITCALLLSVPAGLQSGLPASVSSESEDVRILKHLEQDWLDSYREGDAQKMSKILADDFIGRLKRGITKRKCRIKAVP